MINYKNIGSKLTKNEFNGIVSLLRKNTVLYDEISVENNIIGGKYGKYNLSLNTASILDNGILIKNNASNIGTIELTDMAFPDAAYTLILTVFHNDNGFNYENNIINETKLNIDLKENTPITIDFNTVNKKIIVGFSAIIIIRFDRPLISGGEIGKMDIEGEINWEDINNQYESRPSSVIVQIYANGVLIEELTVTAEDNWKYKLENLNMYDENDLRIQYAVNSNPVENYITEIQNYDLNMVFVGEIINVYAKVVWNDNNNERNMRPTSMAFTLSNGDVFIAKDDNNWTVGRGGLQTISEGNHVNYCWKPQSPLGYVLSSVVRDGDTLVFTYSIWLRPEVPEGEKPPKIPGDTGETSETSEDTWHCFDDFDSPL